MSTIPRVGTPTTLSDQVLETLRTAIVEGTLVSGQMYSVSALSEELGVSRTPTREAVLQLAHIGLLKIVKNQGVIVLEPSQEDFADIMQMRLWIEPPAVKAATEIASKTDKLRVARSHRHLIDAAEAGDAAGVNQYDRLFHRQLLEITGNTRVVELLQDLRDLVVARGQLRGKERPQLTVVAHEHDEILEAFEAGDGDHAADAMRAHLQSTLAGVIGSKAGSLNRVTGV
jgi:DNA-binding GntR family transcriptional regulator